MRRIGFALGLLLMVAGLAPAEDWPGWRGPRGDGTSAETSFPTKWDGRDNTHIVWKTAVPGSGHSSPVVIGDRVYLTTCIVKDKTEGDRVLLCYDRRQGKELWRQTVVTAPLEKKHQLNSYASSTPATDGKHVWVTFLDKPRLRVYCYDRDGNKAWEQSPGEFHSVHGFCSPPVLYKDLVVVNGDQDAEAFLVALDKTTGKERWRTDRPRRTRSYCPPVVIDVNGKPELVLSGSKCVAGYDPDTGKQIWIIDGPTEQFVAGLVYHQGVLFLTAGFPEHHIMGIRPDGTGNVTKTHVLWHERKGASYVPSPVAAAGYFFLVSDEGLGSCFDAKTGKRHWFERLGRHHSASGVTAGGYVYFTADEGVTFVLKAGPTFEVVGKNPLGESCYASPALSDGQIFLRGSKHLFCIGTAAKSSQ